MLLLAFNAPIAEDDGPCVGDSDGKSLCKVLFLLLFLVRPGTAATIFADDFNSFTTGWTPVETGPMPYITGGTIDNPGRGEPAGWTGWIDQGTGENIAIVPGEGRNGTPCLKIGIPKNPSGVWQQIGLVKYLGSMGYDDIYIRFSMKYDQNWRWGNGTGGPFVYHKLVRVWQNVSDADMVGPY